MIRAATPNAPAIADESQNAMTAKVAATTVRMPAVARAAARSRRNFVITSKILPHSGPPGITGRATAGGSGLDAAPTLVLQLSERQRVHAAADGGDDAERRQRERSGDDQRH